MTRALAPALAFGVLASLAASGCVEEPGVGAGYEKPAFKHALVTDQTCTGCHEEDRPAPIEEHPHGGGKVCSSCHTSKDDNSGWLPRNQFNHTPKPDSCLDCHVQDRSKEESHPKTGDCAGCHDYPSFAP
jgi:hypothetical protein